MTQETAEALLGLIAVSTPIAVAVYTVKRIRRKKRQALPDTGEVWKDNDGRMVWINYNDDMDNIVVYNRMDAQQEIVWQNEHDERRMPTSMFTSKYTRVQKP
jgi:hypothetical protein